MSRLVPFNRRSGSPFHSGMGGFYNMMDDFFENMPFFKGFPYETLRWMFRIKRMNISLKLSYLE